MDGRKKNLWLRPGLNMELEHDSQSHWIPLADLMTGLMLVFMLLAMAYMQRVEQTTALVVKDFQETKSGLHARLQTEFGKDLKRWNAELLSDLTIRFNDPDAVFDSGMAELKPGFKEVLQQFFPRYAAVITSPKFSDAVKEVRIEGHTSKRWGSKTDPREAYIENMRLSQERTRIALNFLLQLPAVAHHQGWLIQHVTANGLSSSRPLVGSDKSELAQRANQRVEFRIVTNASDKLDEIARDLQAMQ